MEKVLFFLVHYGLPAIALLLSIVRRPRSRFGVAVGTFLAVAMCLFLFLWGQWPLVGSYYARYLPIAVIAIVLLAVARVKWSEIPLVHPSLLGKALSMLSLAMAILAAYMVWSALAGRQYPEPMVALEFPLKNGDYYVASGGATKVINNHMRSFPNPQEFALDINKLGQFGGASRTILASNNQGHHIFGEAVFAPCAGVVIAAINDVEDNAGTSMHVSAEDGSGNHVSIDCGGTIVSLAHLQFGSLVVATGDVVVAGQELARVGNSGFSQEPHLHLQAATANQESELVGLPMRFASQALVRNDILTVAD
jgi:hypothetical protein